MQLNEALEREFDYLATYIILRAVYEKGIISKKRFEIMNKISALNYKVPPIVENLVHS